MPLYVRKNISLLHKDAVPNKNDTLKFLWFKVTFGSMWLIVKNEKLILLSSGFTLSQQCPAVKGTFLRQC